MVLRFVVLSLSLAGSRNILAGKEKNDNKDNIWLTICLWLVFSCRRFLSTSAGSLVLRCPYHEKRKEAVISEKKKNNVLDENADALSS